MINNIGINKRPDKKSLYSCFEYFTLNQKRKMKLKVELSPKDNKLSYISVYPKSLRILIKEYQNMFFLLARIAHFLLKIFEHEKQKLGQFPIKTIT